MNKLFAIFSFYLFTFSLFAQGAQSKPISPADFQVSDQGVEAIKILEAYKPYVYYDNNDNLIFGYGHLVLDDELEKLKADFGYEVKTKTGKQIVPATNKLSAQEKEKAIDALIRKDIEKVVTYIRDYVDVPLKQHQVDALIIYLYWRGPFPQNPEVSEFYDLVNKRNDKEIVNFMINRHRGDRDIKHYLPGLRRRNTMTAELFITGLYAFD